MSAVRRLGLGPEVGKFIWIMSDGVSPQTDLRDLEDVATGSFFIQVKRMNTRVCLSYHLDMSLLYITECTD